MPFVDESHHPGRLLHAERLGRGLAAGRHAVPGAGAGQGRAGHLRQHRGAGPRDEHRRHHRRSSPTRAASRPSTSSSPAACGARGSPRWPARTSRSTPAVHQMIDVGPIPILEATGSEVGYPIVRDMDVFMYERQTAGSMEVGSYAHRPIFHRPDDIPSIQASRLSPTELPFTAEDFDEQLEDALELMPDLLETAEIKYAINGLLSLTPDGFPLLGETPEVRNLWSAAAVWIKEGPGVGPDDRRVDDPRRARDRPAPVRHRPLLPVRPQRPPRPGPLRRALQQDLRDRPPARAVGVRAQPALRAVPRPHRGPRRHLLPGRRLGAAALVHVQRRRWSRSTASRTVRPSGMPAGGRRSCSAEHLAMRERVGMVDLAPFVVFDVSGPGALDYLQTMTVNSCNVAVGRSVYTPLLDYHGGFRSDLTIMRLGETQFRVVTGAFDGPRDEQWFRKHLPVDGSVTFVDRTSALGHHRRLGAAGPGPRERGHRGRPLQRRLPLRHDPGGAVRLPARPPLPHLVRGRPGLGDLRPDGERAGGVGRACGGPARTTASSPSAPACTGRAVGWRRATASWAPSSAASTTRSRPASPARR